MASSVTPRPVASVLFLAATALAALALYSLGDWEVDPDLFWHLRVAELIKASGPRPLVDTFSYNSVSQPWIPYSWLVELGMLRALDSLGTLALGLIPFLCYLTTLLFVALAVTARAGTSLKAASVVGVVALLILPFIALRPAAIAFPLCAFAAWVVMTERLTRVRILMLVALVPLTALLANFHLFFVFPPILLLLWGMGEWLEDGAGKSGQRNSLFYASLATVSLVLALTATPFGTGLINVIAHYVFDDVMVAQAAIMEMLPFYRLGPLQLWGTILLLAWPVVGWARRRVRPDWRDLALFVFALALVLTHGRYIPLAALLLAPLAATYGPWPRLSPAGARRLSAIGVGLVVGIVYVAGLRVSDARLESDLDRYLESRTTYPVAAARFVRQSVPRRTGHLINEMKWGGYLIYALWPEFQVMVDGRTQLYTERFWRAAYVEASRESRIEMFRQANADAAVLAVGGGSEWADILENELGWRQVYADEAAGVWVPEPAPTLARRSSAQDADRSH